MSCRSSLGQASILTRASARSLASRWSMQRRPWTATRSLKPAVVCVFCGASDGNNSTYVEAAQNLAKAMHDGGMKLVYGGGTTGLMGEIARTLVSLSGPAAVHGIIPEPLVRHEQEQGSFDIRQHLLNKKIYGRTTVVRDMHTRKRMMADEVSNGGPGGGFVALPGGYGTLEETAEIITWNQLGIHAHPVVLYNAGGYWNDITKFIQKAVDAGFVKPENACIVVEAKDERGVISQLRDYQVAQGRFKLKWTDDCLDR